VAREADLTVVIYQNSNRVAANFAFKKGELSEERANDILEALSRVLPKK
jgi:hypothetical protein